MDKSVRYEAEILKVSVSLNTTVTAKYVKPLFTSGSLKKKSAKNAGKRNNDYLCDINLKLS